MHEQANVLMRFEALSEQYVDLSHRHEACKDVELRFRECRKELQKVQVERDYAVARAAELDQERQNLVIVGPEQAVKIRDLEAKLSGSEGECRKLAKEKEILIVQSEITRHRLIRDYFPTFVRRLLQSQEYKRSLDGPFNTAIAAGWLKGVQEGRSPEAVQSILAASTDFDLEAGRKLYPDYDALFDKRYSYVDKISRAYLKTPAELQNLLPDETPPTPGQADPGSAQP